MSDTGAAGGNSVPKKKECSHEPAKVRENTYS